VSDIGRSTLCSNLNKVDARGIHCQASVGSALPECSSAIYVAYDSYLMYVHMHLWCCASRKEREGEREQTRDLTPQNKPTLKASDLAQPNSSIALVGLLCLSRTSPTFNAHARTSQKLYHRCSVVYV